MLRGPAVRLGNSTFDQKLNCFVQNHSRCGQLLRQHSRPEGSEVKGGAKQNKTLVGPSVVGIVAVLSLSVGL